MNSTHAMSFASDVWGCRLQKRGAVKSSVSVANLKEIFAAAQRSQRSGKDAHAGFLQPHRDPTADADIGFCEEDVGALDG